MRLFYGHISAHGNQSRSDNLWGQVDEVIVRIWISLPDLYVVKHGFISVTHWNGILKTSAEMHS